MDNGAQAAETITRVVIMGSTFVLGLSGKAALSVARFAAAAMDENAKQSGKIRLDAYDPDTTKYVAACVGVDAYARALGGQE